MRTRTAIASSTRRASSQSSSSSSSSANMDNCSSRRSAMMRPFVLILQLVFLSCCLAVVASVDELSLADSPAVVREGTEEITHLRVSTSPSSRHVGGTSGSTLHSTLSTQSQRHGDDGTFGTQRQRQPYSPSFIEAMYSWLGVFRYDSSSSSLDASSSVQEEDITYEMEDDAYQSSYQEESEGLENDGQRMLLGGRRKSNEAGWWCKFTLNALHVFFTTALTNGTSTYSLRTSLFTSSDVDWNNAQCIQSCLKPYTPPPPGTNKPTLSNPNCGPPAPREAHLFPTALTCCTTMIPWKSLDECTRVGNPENTLVEYKIKPMKEEKPAKEQCYRSGMECGSMAEKFACCTYCKNGYCK
jgi:hypothetical protein